MYIPIPSDKYKLSDGIFVCKIGVSVLTFYIQFKRDFISTAASFISSAF